jgi:hypothetical protein
MNTRAKLLEIAEFCDNFETRTTYRFDYSTYVYGITACAFAAAAIHNVAGLEARHYGDDSIEFGRNEHPEDHAVRVLGITADQFRSVFVNLVGRYNSNADEDSPVTPGQVADALRRLAEEYDA